MKRLCSVSAASRLSSSSLIDSSSGRTSPGTPATASRLPSRCERESDGLPDALQRRQPAHHAEPHQDARDQDEQHLRDDDACQYLARELVPLVLGLGDPDERGRPDAVGARWHGELRDAHGRAVHLAVVERLRCGRGSPGLRGLRDRRALDAPPFGGDDLEADAVLGIGKEEPARGFGQVELERCRLAVQMERHVARDLEQRAVVGALRELERDPVADEGVGDEQQRKRDQQPAQQLPSQQGLMVAHAFR